MKLDGCRALITGASAGIGREMARQLAARAESLVLVARRQNRLEELREELLQRNPKLMVRLHATDLADPAQLQRLIEWLRQEKIAVDVLINNAGLGDLGPFSTSDMSRLEHMILVNMFALTKLTRATLPDMLAKKRGGILNVSSSAGFLPIAHFSVYAATKAYVTSFSEGLRAEVHSRGISVCSLCPGPVHTEFSEVAQRADLKIPPGPEIAYVSVEDVARAGLEALENDQPLVIPGALMKIGMTFARLMPLSLLRLVSRFSAKRAVPRTS